MNNPADLRPAQSISSVIILPKKLRAEWIDCMALDTNVSHVEFRVGCVIGSHFSGHRGNSYPSQQTLARVTKLSARAIWGAIRGLESKGYLIVKRREFGMRVRRRKDGGGEQVKIAGGRGIANLYFPAFERSQVSATFADQKLAARCDLLWEESSQPGATLSGHKLARRCDLIGEERSQSGVGKLAPRCDPTLKPPTEVNTSRAKAASQDDRLGLAGSLLRKRLGNEVFEAWFGKVDLVQGPPVVTLNAPSRFIRDYLVQHFLEQALTCWRAQYPKVERVEIIFGRAQICAGSAEGGAP